MAAAGSFVFSDKAILNIVALGELGLTSNFKLALVASTWTPVPATDELYTDITGELATGFGYTTGGTALTGVAISQTSGVVKFTSDPVVFTAVGGSIPVWRYGLLYYNGTISGKVKPLIGYFLGDATPANVPITTVGNTVTVTPNALGILSVQRA